MIVACVVGFVSADDKKGTKVTLAGLMSTTPAEWKEEAPSNAMRLMQFKLPKEKGDDTDGELVFFFFPGGSGTIEQNLERQEKKFEIPDGKKKEDAIKVTKSKVGTFDATYQDITGNFLAKAAPFDPNSKVTKKENYRQLYVVFNDEKGDKKGQYYMTLVGPAKTVEAHKKGFDEFLKNFK
jgi:hypothetical protein